MSEWLNCQSTGMKCALNFPKGDKIAPVVWPIPEKVLEWSVEYGIDIRP